MNKKDQTKQKIIDAAQAILRENGFEGLKINDLAKKAGVAKPLVYRYFGDMEGVVAALVDVSGGAILNKGGYAKADSTKTIQHLLYGGRDFATNGLARDLFLWSLASPKGPQMLSSQQLMDESHVDGDKKAIYALLEAAMAFIILYRDRHDTWAGLSIKTPRDMARFEKALAEIVEKTWNTDRA